MGIMFCSMNYIEIDNISSLRVLCQIEKNNVSGIKILLKKVVKCQRFKSHCFSSLFKPLSFFSHFSLCILNYLSGKGLYKLYGKGSCFGLFYSDFCRKIIQEIM